VAAVKGLGPRPLLVAALLVTGVRDAPAQSALGSRYLPLDHWAYEYIQPLLTRGFLPGLNPLVQPYRRLDVARALSRVDPDTLRQPLAGWVRLLKREFASELSRQSGEQRTSAGLEAIAGARGSSSRRLDPARPVGTANAWPWYRGGGWVEAGPLAAELRVYGDLYFRDDPDGNDPGFDPRLRRGGKSDNAYGSVALPFGELVVGHVARNWGPISSPGLMVSGVPTPYPQLAVELVAGRFALRSFAAELDTVGTARRQMAAHRLDYTAKDLVLSLGEATVYLNPALQLRFLNPFELLVMDANDRPQQNLMLDAQLWLRRGGLVVYADALLDDIDISPTTPEPEPPQYGFTLSARYAGRGERSGAGGSAARGAPLVLPPWIELGAEYQQVGAWTYRTPNFADRYSYFNRGLGANYSDYDRLTLWADLYPPVPGLRISPTALLQRQGEGNFRDSIPGGYYWGRPALFWGVKETTLRLGLRGRYQPIRELWINWDLGPNFTRNRAHVTGVNRTSFEAVGEIGVRLVFPRSR